jgi:hypothetical protein
MEKTWQMTYGQIISTIECYIYLKTNQNVLIAMPRNVGEIKKMQQMYEVAKNNVLYMYQL